MTRDKIIQLIQSSNKDDVEIGLQFIGNYPLRDIKSMFPKGVTTHKGSQHAIKANTSVSFNIQYWRLSSFLFLCTYMNNLVFHSQPRDGVKYKSIYDET